MSRPTIAEINLGNLEYNFRNIREYAAGAGVIAIVKANAYGHGILEVSKKLDKLGVEAFGVAYPDEAAILRENGIGQPIIVLVPGLGREYETVCKYGLEIFSSDILYMERLNKEAKEKGVIVQAHLNIESGMNRDGIPPEEAIGYLNECAAFENIRFKGICTHFSSAESDKDYTDRQAEIFQLALNKLKKAGYEFEMAHAHNSAALVNLDASAFTHIRPGLALYGMLPSEKLHKKISLKPVMALKTKVNMVRKISKGDSVGYGRLFIAEKDTTLATLPVGYGDGYFKILTGKAECLINGKRYKIAGSVCMDQCMADVGVDEVKPGDEAVLLGSQGRETISAYEIAEKAGTIPYEVTTNISSRPGRVFINK